MMKTICLLLTLLLGALPAFSAMKESADSAYEKKNYAEAAERYENVLKQGVSPDVCYNLGNAYYRLNDLPKAVLNYRRALKYDPAHGDARFNLSLCESKLADRFDRPEEMFFVSWWRNLWQGRSADWWGGWAVAAWGATLLSALLYLFGRFLWLRKTGFFAGLLCLCLAVVFNLFAGFQKERFQGEQQIVLSAATSLYASPSASAKPLRQLHEGCTLVVAEGDAKGWKLVELPDGTSGWIPDRNLWPV